MAKEFDISKLAYAIQTDRRVLEPYRRERYLAVQQYAGKHWGEGSREKVFLNFIALYVSVVGRNLVSKDPRVLLSTFDRSIRPAVKAMQTWANQEIERIHLATTFQRAVMDALFSVGVMKVAIATPADAASYAWNLKAGEPIAHVVDLDDFVFDTHARDWSEVSYIGHRYRAPREVVREDKSFTKARKDLPASERSPYNEQGDDKLSSLGRGQYSGVNHDFEEFVDLWEVYLPRHRVVLTLEDDSITGASARGDEGVIKPLREQGFIGPDAGPYHMLGFGIVPGNCMPKAPIQDIIDPHMSLNRLMRKVAKQSERQKTLGVAQNVEDAKRAREADDGDVIHVEGMQPITEVSYGGPNAQVWAMIEAMQTFMNKYAGNVDIIGGLEPQSKTATQDKMLNENSAKTVQDMQSSTVRFVSQVIEALCWYWWHDPFKVMKTTHSISGLNIQRDIKISPEQRRAGRFADLQIRVDPYSLQHQTPQAKLSHIRQLVQTVIIPMMPLLQQQGVAFDLNRYLQMESEYGDLPELTEIITIQEPPAQESPSSEPTSMPAQTNRSYTRENVPMRTARGDSQNRVNTLMNVPTGGAQRNGTNPWGPK